MQFQWERLKQRLMILNIRIQDLYWTFNHMEMRRFVDRVLLMKPWHCVTCLNLVLGGLFMLLLTIKLVLPPIPQTEEVSIIVQTSLKALESQLSELTQVMVLQHRRVLLKYVNLWFHIGKHSKKIFWLIWLDLESMVTMKLMNQVLLNHRCIKRSEIWNHYLSNMLKDLLKKVLSYKVKLMILSSKLKNILNLNLKRARHLNQVWKIQLIQSIKEVEHSLINGKELFWVKMDKSLIKQDIRSMISKLLQSSQ